MMECCVEYVQMNVLIYTEIIIRQVLKSWPPQSAGNSPKEILMVQEITTILETMMTSVRRIPQIVNLTGSMTGIEVRINVSRKYTFYIAKIYTLLWLMTFSSLYVLAIETHRSTVGATVFSFHVIRTRRVPRKT